MSSAVAPQLVLPSGPVVERVNGAAVVRMPDGRVISKEEFQIGRFVRQKGGLRGTLYGESMGIVQYLQDRFYIIETPGKAMRLYDPQPAILEFILENNPYKFKFRETLWSTPKKHGKTTITSGVARWVCETKGPFAECYAMANSLEQAKGRIFNGIEKSLRLTPGFDRGARKVLLSDGSCEWAVLDRTITHEPTNGVITAVSNSYKGNAGSNPTMSAWSETWGMVEEDDTKMWAELTPVPTRAFSLRWVETYAGYQDSPGVLLDYWNLGTDTQLGAKRLDCHSFPNWPQQYMWECNCDAKNACGCGHKGPGLPLFVNEDAAMFAFCDQDERAHRAPWVQGELGDIYYSQQRKTFASDPSQYERLHLNHWIVTQNQFAPPEWYDACFDELLPTLMPGSNVPIVIAADAAVTNDCCALVAVSRWDRNTKEVAARMSRVFEPPSGGQFDYEAPNGLMATLREWIANYNVVQVCYDPYQLHQVMQNLRNEGTTWCKEFSQGTDRMKADQGLFGLIRDRQFHHQHGPTSLERQHFLNADKKYAPNEDTKFRIVKRHDSLKIDNLVATSMAAHECLRLELD